MTKFIGIDPGVSGAIGCYNAITGEVSVHDMPIYKIKTNKKMKSHIDLYEMVSIIKGHGEVAGAAVEQVSSMPGQGVTSCFNFGFSAGCAQMVIAAHQIPLTTVSPVKWKKAMGLSSDKDASRRLASRTFPKYAHLWNLKKHDGRAEAVLLAYYLSKLNNGAEDIFA